MTGKGDTPLLAVAGIEKRYGELRANHNVGLHIKAGEIHALLGENGAGKSTLVKIICGVEQADEGTTHWQGEQVHIASPSQARDLGIGVVFQHFSLFRAMTVEENIELGLPGIDKAVLREKIVEVSARYGFALVPTRPLYTLSVGEWQRVEIVRCLLTQPRLLILDEPTSVLTPQEAELLFKTLRQLAEEGCAILYISHRLAELKELCQKATVMRLGEVVTDCDPREETPASLAQMMIGHIPESLKVRGHAVSSSDDALVLEGLSLPKTGSFGVPLKNIKLRCGAGQVTSIAGIAGNGQPELAEALSGERLVAPGVVKCFGASVGALGPGDRRELGMHYVPEERHGHGAVPEMRLWENASLTSRGQLGMMSRRMINIDQARSFSEAIISKFDVRCSGANAAAGSLSGGNLQKFIIGREIIQKPKLLIVVQPTWGVDAGAASNIRQALLDLAASGASVLVISQDLDEIMEISDLIAVIADGRLSDAHRASELSAEKIGLMMSDQLEAA